MTIVNLTPHPIVLRAADGTDHVFPSAGVARVTSTPGVLDAIPGVPVPVADASVFGQVIGLPDATCEWCGSNARPGEVCAGCGRGEPHPLFVVSAIVGAAVKGRRDVVCPGTGPADGAIRDDKGHIIAVTRLVRPG